MNTRPKEPPLSAAERAARIGARAILIAAIVGAMTAIVVALLNSPTAQTMNASSPSQNAIAPLKAPNSEAIGGPSPASTPTIVGEDRAVESRRPQAGSSAVGQTYGTRAPRAEARKGSINFNTNCAITNSTINDVTIQDCSGSVR